MTTRAQTLGMELENMVLDKIEGYKKNSESLKLCLADIAEILNSPEWKSHLPMKMKYATMLMNACGMDFKLIWDVAIAFKAGKIPHYGGDEKQKELEVAQKLVAALTDKGREQLLALVEQKIGKQNVESDEI